MVGRKRQQYDDAELTPHLRVGGQPIIDRSPQNMEIEGNGNFLTNDTLSDYSNSTNSTNSTNMEIQTFSASRVGSSGVTAGRGHHGETQVTKKTTRFNPIDETEQVIMPYRTIGNMVCESNQRFATVLTFRLNSIYDIIQESLTNANYNTEKTPGPEIQPDIGTGVIQVPHYREYWKKLYNYWHVIKCDWTFHFRPSARYTETENVDYCLIAYEHGLQTPPTYASLGGSPEVVENIPWFIRKYHPHTRMQPIQVFKAGADDHITDTWQSMSGSFKPGNIAHEVVEDEFNQIWHKWTEVPPTAEKLTIMLQPKDRSMDTDGYKLFNALTIRYVMTMEYTVQLKDRIHTFQYLTQGTDFPVTDNILQQPAPLNNP